MKIVVLDIYGLNLGFLGCYGNDWVGTPNLDRLAAEGVVFDRHILDRPDVGERPTIVRSALAQAIAGAGLAWVPTSCSKIIDFAELTGAALDRLTGPGVCWIDGPKLTPSWEVPDVMLSAYCDEADPNDTPWPDPTEGVVPADIDLFALQNTYAGVVTYFDNQVGLIVEDLKNRGWLDDTLLCVTARAGLPLAEHQQIGFTHPWLHEELVHVPMIWRLPGGKDAGLRIAALTQPADLRATFAAALGLAISATDGFDLWPLLAGSVDAVRDYACSQLHIGERREASLRSLDWAYLLPLAVSPGDSPRSPQLYEKPNDRWEVNDVLQHAPEVVEELDAALREVLGPGERGASAP